jgi:hypothetical protein
MTSLKGRFTVHEVENRHIAEVLAREPSPKRRSRLLVRYADLGRMLEKMGVTGANGIGTVLQPAVAISGIPEPPPTLNTDLGNTFFDNALADYMSHGVDRD